MDLMGALEMLVRSAEGQSFSAAARQLGVTPAAVSKQIAKLEQHLGLQLLVRNTRQLTVTEAGQRLLQEAIPGLVQVHAALGLANQQQDAVAGVLKVSLAPAFGRHYVLPVMGPLLQQHPQLRLDWHFDNRQIDLVGEGFDAGIAGGLDLAGGLVARPLVPLHLVLVAAPGYVARKGLPLTPEQLAAHDTLALRSPNTGRARPWQLHNKTAATSALRGTGKSTTRALRQLLLDLPSRIWVSDSDALVDAALCGYGIALVGLPHARPHLDSGALQRVLPSWWSDLGAVSVYFPHSKLLPAKTRVFVDHLTAVFEEQGLAQRLSALRGKA
jgi:DNA-binding transcriptional LysR family regulator